jgi:hypothetical protein
MGRRRVPTGAPVTKVLACGMLEDGGRVFFLVRRDAAGFERIEMPCVLVPSGRSPFAEIKAAFPAMTGIDCQVHEIVMEGRHNAGTRRRRFFVPCLVFRITARNRTARISGAFSGFRWLSLDDAKRLRMARELEWLRTARQVRPDAGSGEEQEKEQRK